MTCKQILTVGVFAILFVPITQTASAQEPTAERTAVEQTKVERTKVEQSATQKLERQLDRLAADVSTLLADNSHRATLAAQFKTAPRKNVIVLEEFLGASIKKNQTAIRRGENVSSIESTFALAAMVSETQATMKTCGLSTTRLDIKVPVKGHLDLLGNSEAVYVLAAPTAEEGTLKSVTAYSNGKPISLSAEEPPKLPTVVILPAESESIDPDYPLLISAEEGEETNKDRVVDDFVGIARIWIDDDHENWWCGDPEIYVRVIRFRFSPFGIINQRINLPGVNDEQVWYNIGDPNGTYRFVSRTNFAPVIQFQVWEADSGSHGSDDHLGTITVTWTSLSFAGYRTFTNGDARIRVDRD